MDIDYDEVRRGLEVRFAEVEKLHLLGQSPEVPAQVAQACTAVFNSKTQAYREVLLGCILARLASPQTNIRQPYVEQGDDAFSGRTLDERVVNPFLQSAQIPSSKGPYLSVFRRNIQFDESTRGGLRDKDGYDAFLQALTYIEAQSTRPEIGRILDHVLYKFVSLREEAKIQLARLPRISLSQYESLIAGLLNIPSGGRVPVIIVVSMLKTISKIFSLDWAIKHSGINVADAASGAPGDITVLSAGKPLIVL